MYRYCRFPPFPCNTWSNARHLLTATPHLHKSEPSSTPAAMSSSHVDVDAYTTVGRGRAPRHAHACKRVAAAAAWQGECSVHCGRRCKFWCGSVGVALRRQHNRVCGVSMVHCGATIVRCARCSGARREDGAGEGARPGWCSNTKSMVPSV